MAGLGQIVVGLGWEVVGSVSPELLFAVWGGQRVEEGLGQEAVGAQSHGSWLGRSAAVRWVLEIDGGKVHLRARSFPLSQGTR